ncbi:MAG: type III-B CRISPR module RAMP protein Cmr1 [Pseudomonadota bacterium]
MKILEATYSIVTPMFIGDAEQKASDLRPPSIKGALRFWWRALNWGKYLRLAEGNIAQALQTLHTEESKLFGIAAQENRGGQGQFILQVSPTHLRVGKNPPPATGGLPYLLGQGVYHFKNGYLRNALQAGQNFSVKVCFRPTAKAEDVDSVAQALLLFGLLGGLGSRARKGFGAVAIHQLIGSDQVTIPQNINEYNKIINKLCQTMPADLPPFTAFSQKSRVDISLTGDDAWQLLEQVGREMLLYRSYGSSNSRSGLHTVLNNQKAEQNFSADHDLVLEVAEGGTVTTHPDRVVFGLPHNYFFSSGDKVDVNGKSEGRGRRASPLFIHLHEFPDGKCAAIQALLPAIFLPPSDRIELKARQATSQVSPQIDWDVIVRFLDRFKNRQRIYP